MPTPSFIEPNYFKITCIDDGGSDFDMPELGVQFKSSKNGTAPAVKLFYRINGRKWIEWGLNLKKQLVTGDYIEIKGDPSNMTFCGTTNPLTNADSITLNFNAGALPQRPVKAKVSGDITTLLDGIGGILDISDRVACFAWLFEHSPDDVEVDCEDLELPSTTLGNICYRGMFSNLSEQLKKAPAVLPAPTIVSNAYNAMFQHCTAITRAPFIMATSCGTLGCQKMFYSCNSLAYIKCSLEPGNMTAMKLNSWVTGVPDEGLYEYTDPNADPNAFTRGANGVPRAWELRLAEEQAEKEPQHGNRGENTLAIFGNKVKMLAINGLYVKTLFINGNKVLM